MINNYEILQFMNKNKQYKGYQVAQTDSKQVPGASHLLFKAGVDRFLFVRIIEPTRDTPTTDKILAIEELASYKFSEFETVKYDQFSLSQRYTFTRPNGEQLIVKTWVSSATLRSALPDKVKLIVVDRKWYNRIVGFRSKDPLHMFIATAVYAAIIFLYFKYFF
ncbi:MAG: hypothetical protein ACRC0Q_03715 [Kurthia gibsonii]